MRNLVSLQLKWVTVSATSWEVMVHVICNKGVKWIFHNPGKVLTITSLLSAIVFTVNMLFLEYSLHSVSQSVTSVSPCSLLEQSPCSSHLTLSINQCNLQTTGNPISGLWDKETKKKINWRLILCHSSPSPPTLQWLLHYFLFSTSRTCTILYSFKSIS